MEIGEWGSADGRCALRIARTGINVLHSPSPVLSRVEELRDGYAVKLAVEHPRFL